MNLTMPNMNAVRERLLMLNQHQIGLLSDLSGVGISTIEKIRYGNTMNPGVETVAKILEQLTVVMDSTPEAKRRKRRALRSQRNGPEVAQPGEVDHG